MKSFILWVLFVTCILKPVECQLCGSDVIESTFPLRRLFGFSLETVTNHNLHTCIRRCMSDRRCVSFNHRETEQMCELNSETADSVESSYLIDSEYWNHYIPGVMPLRCDASICPESDTCYMVKDTYVCYPNPPRCPTGYFQFEQKCYYFHRYYMPWNSGKTLCQNMGATMGTVRTWRENIYVVEAIKGLMDTAGQVHVYWFGVRYASEYDDWVFIPDGTPINMTYATWSPARNTDQFCGLIHYTTDFIAAWLTNDCLANTGVICEKTL